MKTVLLIATLDTKLQEAEYLKKSIEAGGCECLILDCSLVENHSAHDELRKEMLALSGIDESTLASRPKNETHPLIQSAACALTSKLYEEGRIDGGIGIGGVQGTTMAAEALQKLPIGVPKMLFSAVANGQMTFGPFVGMSDMTIMHSVVDVAGNNHLIKRLLDHAGKAISAMVLCDSKDTGNRKKTIGITMGGVTTKCVDRIKARLETEGYEVLVFHCNGIGAEAMEALVADGAIDAVMDITPHDVMDRLMSGLMPAAENRYRAVIAAKISLLIAPGCADIILYGGMDHIPENKRGRKTVKHNELHTHVKADYNEMHLLGEYFKNTLGESKTPVSIMIPRKGFSQKNVEGGPLYEPESDQGFVDAITENTPSNFEVIQIDAHINDELFANACADRMLAIMAGAK